MKWRGARRSGNIEDRRGMGPGKLVGGGIGGVLLLLVAVVFGVDPGALMDAGGGAAAPATQVQPGTPEDEAGQWVAAVVGYTEDTWTALFAEEGLRYEPPTLVLFDDAVSSACGMAGSAVGPFYCPLDQKVYIDLAFFRELEARFGAAGDFAAAYVIAHEVGHHVQTLLGISDQVRAAQARAGQAEANQLSVRQELQADCFAGLWAARTQQGQEFLEAGDVEEALGAAAAIGDDTLQRRTQGHVVPESFTHGTSAQRTRWFRTGLQGGDIRTCDTFEGTD